MRSLPVCAALCWARSRAGAVSLPAATRRLEVNHAAWRKSGSSSWLLAQCDGPLKEVVRIILRQWRREPCGCSGRR
jgi:hypothetical protein